MTRHAACVIGHWSRPSGAPGTLASVDRSEVAAAIAAHIDRNHLRLGSRLMKLRWGGLRTVEPARSTWAGLGALGVAMGVVARSLVGRGRDGRHRTPLVPALVIGVASVWFGVWRLDSLRWRRSHVTLVLDMPGDVLDELIARLQAEGVRADRHDGPRTVGGAPSGLTCRLRDLRRVNAHIDELDAVAGQRAVAGGV